MRTRLYDSLNQREIDAYLKRNDLIVLPVGVSEIHGELPVGCEHVLPLAIALRLAAAADGLVLPGLSYFHPGATGFARATIRVRPTVGLAYLKEILTSLGDSGFHRIVLVAFHAPAPATLGPLVREFWEEHRKVIVFFDMDAIYGAVNQQRPGSLDFDTLFWGAYHDLGRLEEIPADARPLARRTPYPKEVAALQKVRGQFGYYYQDATQHGWWPDRPLTPPQRRARAAAGQAQLGKLVEFLEPQSLGKKIKDLQKMMERDVLPHCPPPMR